MPASRTAVLRDAAGMAASQGIAVCAGSGYHAELGLVIIFPSSASLRWFCYISCGNEMRNLIYEDKNIPL